MKKIINYIYLLMLTGICLIHSCSEKVDDAYINPNAATRQPVESLLPGIIGNMVGNSSAQGSGYGTANDALYVGRYVQFWATNIANNQFDQMGGATGASDILGAVWAAHYYGMGGNLNRMIEWGTEEQKWDYVGVGYAIRAWSWLMLTTMHGEVILTEAFRRDQLVFAFDEQAQVYDTVRALCRRAIFYLDQTGGNANQANLAKGDAYFYNGDVNKWKKFVYSVMARSFNHLSNKSSYNPDSVLYYADLGINANADNGTAKFANTGISGTSNFFGPLRNNIGALRPTEFAADLLKGENPSFIGVEDPRIWYLLRENFNGVFSGITPGLGNSGLPAANRPNSYWNRGFDTTTAPTSDATLRYIYRNGSPFPIITASEIQFIKAEAFLRKGENDNALNAYREGIRLSFELLQNEYPFAIPAGREITNTVTDDFLNDPDVVPAAADLSLSDIMLQKYIAMYGYGALEVWTDLRRYHYTDLDPATGEQVYAAFTLPGLFINNNGKPAYRARPRYNSEYLYNTQELDKLGGLALDYHTKEQWFSQE